MEILINMEGNDVPTASEMFRAQAHIYKHTFHFANSMVLRCAIQLGIPDIIHSHKQPMTLSELVSELKLPPAKSNGIYRLMRLLKHSGWFDTKKLDETSETQEGYVLTASSKLLLKSEIPNLSPFVRALVDPVMVIPWQCLGDWFLGNEATSFETVYGAPMWEYCDQNPRYNKAFNEAMSSDSEMTSLVVKDCREIFEELDSLVDVGGGTGVMAKTILGAFPRIKCTVLDLLHVVANMPEIENLKYVGGDMFQSIPPADAFLFKAHIYKHAFGYANSMALNCAIQFGIPDIIHNHKKPITLPELLSALKLPSSKSTGIYRLMCLLVHSRFFATVKIDENSDTEGYILTTPSRVIVDPILFNTWKLLGEWFRKKNEEATAFETAYRLCESFVQKIQDSTKFSMKEWLVIPK
ncbi:trans-resveratrol di-O-methyltransferase-like [Nicotiana sylvestris]|uniref:trans-resveratrol di-O-methyltransferase-like n=1 Tax=Nicotiana sylvestris TaxID=4096 RepID=UPI00388CA10B